MLYFIIISIFSPSIWITSSVNINLFDFLPFFMLLDIILNKKTDFYFYDEEKTILFVFFVFTFILLLSTWIAFLYFEGQTINTFLQLYRRIISFIFIPFYIFNYEEINLKKIFFFISIIALSVGVIGELINFIPWLREILLYKIVSNQQIVVSNFWRNMGFTGEGSYFANVIIITLFINIFFETKWKYFFIVSLFLIILTTFSKSVLASFIVTIILYFIYIKRTHYLIGYFIIGGMSIFILIWYLDLFEVMNEYFTSRAESSLEGRTNYIWIKVLDFIGSENITYLTGLGFKGLKYYADVAGAHNQYLSLFANFGIFSLFYLWVFFIFIPFSIYKISKNPIFIFLAILFMIECLVHEPLTHTQVIALYIFVFVIIIKFYLKVNYEKSFNP